MDELEKEYPDMAMPAFTKFNKHQKLEIASDVWIFLQKKYPDIPVDSIIRWIKAYRLL